MNMSKRITPEVLAAASNILQPYCPELSPTDLVEAIQNHKNDTAKAQTLQPSLTYADFAELAGMSLPTVHRMARRGELPTVKIGPRLVRIPYLAVQNILNGTQISGGK